MNLYSNILGEQQYVIAIVQFACMLQGVRVGVKVVRIFIHIYFFSLPFSFPCQVIVMSSVLPTHDSIRKLLFFKNP